MAALTTRAKFFSWGSKNSRQQPPQEYHRIGGLLPIDLGAGNEDQFLQNVVLDDAKVSAIVTSDALSIPMLARITSLASWYRRVTLQGGWEMHTAFACGRYSLVGASTHNCIGYNMASKSKEPFHHSARLYHQPKS